jgi:hypothetical protein
MLLLILLPEFLILILSFLVKPRSIFLPPVEAYFQAPSNVGSRGRWKLTSTGGRSRILGIGGSLLLREAGSKLFHRLASF